MTAVVAAIVSAAGAAGGCGSPPPAKPASKPVAQPEFDPCADNPQPVKKTYFGILKNVRCDQDLFSRMAEVAGSLNVECDYCHLHDRSGDLKKFDFPAMTDRKQIALFMQHEFVEGLTAEGRQARRMRESCHVDKNGKPAAKFLGQPRDISYTVEWMNLVMVNRFTHLDGTKVKCRDCHVGNYTMPEFQPKVIMHAEQIQLPGVTPYSKQPDVPLGDGILQPIKPKTKLPKAPPLPGQHANADDVSAPTSG